MPGLVNLYYFDFILSINTHLADANSVDPNQTPQIAASDLDLHCLHTSRFR